MWVPLLQGERSAWTDSTACSPQMGTKAQTPPGHPKQDLVRNGRVIGVSRRIGVSMLRGWRGGSKGILTYPVPSVLNVLMAEALVVVY
jgi:hypothetical protein